jgi:N-methylhydantoinase B
VLPSKCDQIAVEAGDQLIYRTAGGGGWKDPLSRPAEFVQRDVQYGLVSKDKAERDYGVILDDALEIDYAATEAKRAQIAEARGEVKGFDFGPPLEALLANAEAETGLPAPRKPQPVKWAVAKAARRARNAQEQIAAD